MRGDKSRNLPKWYFANDKFGGGYVHEFGKRVWRDTAPLSGFRTASKKKAKKK